MKKKKLLAAAMMAAGLLATSAAYAEKSGGVIGTDVTLPIENQTYTNGSDTGDGGALENQGYAGTISGTTFTNNAARYGGAIENNGSGSNLTINGGSFSNNHSTGSSGAIDNDGGASLTIQNGTQFIDNYAGKHGGAIGNWEGNLTISGDKLNKVIFTNNSTASVADGGAIFNSDTLTIDYAEFINNHANNEGSYGGAISNGGELNIDNTLFDGNTANIAGALFDYLDSSGGVSVNGMIQNTVFKNNSASEIGAVGLFTKMANSVINNAKFENNFTTFNNASAYENSCAGGGALFLGSESMVTVNNTTFNGNTTTLEGGAISTRNTAQNNVGERLSIIKSTFTNNKAGVLNNGTASNLATDHGLGGAIYANVWHDAEGNDSAKISDSIFASNSAVKGGAIFNDAAAGKIGNLTISNSTFDSNTATTAGGAIYNKGIITLAGTNTFIGNTANGVANDIDGVTNGSTTGLINIANGVTTLSAIKHQTVSVDNGAELHLSTTATDGTNLAGSTVSVASGATINTIDNAINNYANIALASGSNIKLDVDLTSGSEAIDTYTASGSINLKELSVTTDGAGATLTVASGANIVADNLVAYTSAKKYTVTGLTGEDAGKVTIAQVGTGGIQVAVSDTATPNHNYVSYNQTNEDSIYSDVTVTDANMSINGNGTNPINLGANLGVDGKVLQMLQTLLLTIVIFT